jgi:hypothetical protein
MDGGWWMGCTFSALKWLEISYGSQGEDGVQMDNLFIKVFSLMNLEKFEFDGVGFGVSCWVVSPYIITVPYGWEWIKFPFVSTV